MTNVAKKLTPSGAFLESGFVAARTAGGFAVRTPFGQVTAERATSCLLEPEIDDRVLVAQVDDAAYVLAVLSRDSVDARVVVPGDL